MNHDGDEQFMLELEQEFNFDEEIDETEFKLGSIEMQLNTIKQQMDLYGRYMLADNPLRFHMDFNRLSQRNTELLLERRRLREKRLKELLDKPSRTGAEDVIVKRYQAFLNDEHLKNQPHIFLY